MFFVWVSTITQGFVAAMPTHHPGPAASVAFMPPLTLFFSLSSLGVAASFDVTSPLPPIEPALLAPGTATRAFVSRTLGDHMVLQAAPQSAVVWGATVSGAVVTTTFDGHSYEATANLNGTWRQRLPPTGASTKPYTLSMVSTVPGENATLSDVVFGEVFVCGGQSNMEFAVPALTNSTDEAQRANAYPQIRIFTVGHATSSNVPLLDLQTVWEPWRVASNLTIRRDFGPGHTLFSTFSAVCWLFGRELADALAQQAGVAVPVGLVRRHTPSSPHAPRPRPQPEPRPAPHRSPATGAAPRWRCGRLPARSARAGAPSRRRRCTTP